MTLWILVNLSQKVWHKESMKWIDINENCHYITQTLIRHELTRKNMFHSCQIRIIHAENDSTETRIIELCSCHEAKWDIKWTTPLRQKIGAACLGILLNLVSKSAARCKRLSDPFLSHGTPWLRCLLQRSPHPVWFCSTHVDRRPLSNGAVVTPAKKTKTALLSTKQDAHMHNGERPSPTIPDLLCCKKENNIHPHTKKK